MRDRSDELGDAEVAVVTFSRQRTLRGYRGRLGLACAVLADEDRAAYRAYGLGRGPWWRVYGPTTVRRYAELVRSQGSAGLRAALTAPGHDDTLQLGGDFVVGRDGRLMYVFRSEGPDDRPDVDELVTAVARA